MNRTPQTGTQFADWVTLLRVLTSEPDRKEK